MNGENSILDKIIASQEKQQAASFNPDELISALLKNLSNKESDILARRFGLLGKEKETLEQIGKHYEITRERIRQIETATIKKIKELKDFKNQMETAEHYITHFLENYGGLMEENFLLNEINLAEPNQNNYQASRFILNHLLSDKIETVKPDSEFLSGWRLPIVSLELIRQAVKILAEIIDQEKKLLKAEELLELFVASEFYKNNKEQISALKIGLTDQDLSQEIDKLIHSYLKISKKIEQNILGEWGLSHWQTIVPKRMSDKIYLVLRKVGKPLHFTEIAELINRQNFDKKVAYPATIHNELILDDRFVLVGRGMYALSEWGYKPGIAREVIQDILKRDGELSKDEIVKRVMKERYFKKNTILVNLANSKYFRKNAKGLYVTV